MSVLRYGAHTPRIWTHHYHVTVISTVTTEH